ncbi:MAG: CcoQ/FixQ family Cbb3-type cytochrome c oxidase assembly chaperone [Flavobacteriales bacterium]|nr:CcoQ/FixQ family Cbb3-type cytochrome c oxidase assembly chaperone [Flavobacteriales bacterium]MCX7649095.1 CcoQ/FixQ family Cbb3-type cytochrome c oxidase assembly chaperone [Flavobacteriales bacterium]MDW8431599.1 CcoQ/FixQ family Cbb3-type cytochrome c oxidase assembly chaperone [Flavobacteriales bacterium]
MYKDVASRIPDVWIYPTISLVIFFTFFLILFVVVFTRRRELVQSQKMIPLEDGTHLSEKSKMIQP